MEFVRALGLLDTQPVDVDGKQIVPRKAFIASAQPKLTKKNGKDLVALRVIVEGTKDGQPRKLEWELVDRYDEKNGISAMMRTTGYSLAITGMMQARGEVRPFGVHTPDEAMPGKRYIEELAKRGVMIRQVT
jgi:lysine 6-dehydrogenase